MWPRRKPVRVRPVTPSHCGRSGISEVSYALHAGSIPAPATTGPVAQPGSAAPLQGEGCGFDSRAVHHADVAQRERHGAQTAASVGSNPTVSTNLDVAQRERTGFGSRGLEVRVLPSRPMRGGGTGTTPGPD